MGMGKLYIINATAIAQKIRFWIHTDEALPRRSSITIQPGGQEEIGDDFDDGAKMSLIQHIERYGGLDISETHQTPPGFCGLAYRWDKPATESDIERAHEVDMTRRQKVSAREMVTGAKVFDGRLRQIPGLRGDAMISETVVEEVAPHHETPPSGGLKSRIIGTLEGGRLDI